MNFAQFTQADVMFFIGIAGVIFGVYHYFRNPQIKAEKNETVLSLQVKNLSDELVDLKKNHIHTLEQKIETSNTALNALAVRVAELSTIINERIPKKE